MVHVSSAPKVNSILVDMPRQLVPPDSTHTQPNAERLSHKRAEEEDRSRHPKAAAIMAEMAEVERKKAPASAARSQGSHGAAAGARRIRRLLLAIAAISSRGWTGAFRGFARIEADRQAGHQG